MATHREPCETCGCTEYQEYWGPVCSQGNGCANQIHADLLAAVAAERERCAKLVEAEFATVWLKDGRTIPLSWETDDISEAREKVAKEIRNG